MLGGIKPLPAFAVSQAIDQPQKLGGWPHRLGLRLLPRARPPHWGGWLLIPDVFEFWQGRPNRLHDRFRYRRDDVTQEWVIERLAP